MRTLKIEFSIEVSDQHIDDIMTTALEGGITYWCGKVEPILIPDGLEENILMSDLISKGGSIKMYDAEDEDETWELTTEKFMNGLKQYCIENSYSDMDDLIDNHDADVADTIVQYALFGELVFG